MKNFKRIGVLTLSLSLVLSLTGCKAEKKDAGIEEKVVDVTTTTPVNGSIEIMGDFVGEIAANEQVSVVCKSSGDVTATYFEIGDQVNVGDLLCTIDDSAAQIQLKQANATLSSAQASLGTAQAGVNTATANVTYTQAQVNENMNKSLTNQKQMELAANSATFNYYNAQDQRGVLEEALKDLDDKIKDIDDDIEELKSKKRYYKNHNSGGEYNSIIASLEVSIEQLESSKDSVESSKRSTEANYNAASRAICTTGDNAEIAKDQLNDYNNYTMATIGTGSLAQLASAQGSLATAQAGVTQSKAGITQAKTAVEAAQLQLDNTKVTAPVAGTITGKKVSVNNMTSAGSVAYVISVNDTQFVEFNVSEDVMKVLEIGQQVDVDRNGSLYKASITENSGIIDTSSGLFKIKAKLETDEVLPDSGKVKLTFASDRADNVMTIPVSAVYYAASEAYVFAVENGRCVKKPVVIGLTDETKVEVQSGLTGDEKIITNWTSQLKEGLKVNVQNVSSVGSSNVSDVIVVEVE